MVAFSKIQLSQLLKSSLQNHIFSSHYFPKELVHYMFIVLQRHYLIKWDQRKVPGFKESYCYSSVSSYRVGPTKMSLFFFGNKFYKNKETFKIFSPQLLEFYRILLVETNLESIMFYYTFSVTNTIFVPCTALLYDSTAATWT